MANYGFAIDLRKCIGCHACTIACKAEHEIPIGVNRCWVKTVEKGSFPETRRFFFPVLCNQCTDAPCVRICPTNALFKRRDGIVDLHGDSCIGCRACMSHHLGRWRLKEHLGGARNATALVSIARGAGGKYSMRQEHGAQPFKSNDPDSQRIWWSEVGVHQNLTFPVQPDPVSGMAAYRDRVEAAR